eukprot:g28145.t1
MKTPDVAITEGSQGVGDTLRQRIRGIVSSVFFEALAGCIILSNAVVIGLEVEYMAINREYRSPVWFQTLHLLHLSCTSNGFANLIWLVLRYAVVS